MNTMNKKLQTDLNRIRDKVKTTQEENILVKRKTCHLQDQISKKDNKIVDLNKNMELVQKSNETIINRKDRTIERLND